MPFHPDQYTQYQHWRYEDIPDCIWPSDNPYDIPLLRPDLQGNALDLPVVAWGSVRRSHRMLGSWHFYVDDYRFSRLWTDPSPILNSGCATIIEPNFSITDQTPTALALYRLYQKRWLARTWQELGRIRVFVDLNIGARHQELALLGVPDGWRAYATRGYTDKLDLTDAEYAAACRHRGSEDVLFVVVGGGHAVEQHARSRGWMWIPEQRTLARERHTVAREHAKERG